MMYARPIDVYKWNDWIDYIQARLNDLKSAYFRSAIDQDKFVEPTLKRTDVGVGASKVIEADDNGDVVLKPVVAATSVYIGPSATNNLSFTFSNRRINFKLNNAIKTYADYSGWQGLT